MQNFIQEWLKQQEEHSYAEARLRQSEFDLKNLSDASNQTKDASAVEEQRRLVEASGQALAALVQQITQRPDAKQYADDRRTGLRRQLHEIIGKLHPNVTGARLTLNQGLIFNDYLFNRIYTMLRHSVEDEFAVCEIPHFMYSDDSRFDEVPLKNYLATMKDELLSLPLNSFLDLHAYLLRKQEGFFALAKE